MMKIMSLLRCGTVYFGILVPKFQRSKLYLHLQGRRDFRVEDGNSMFISSNGTKLLDYNVPSLKIVILSYHHQNIKSPHRIATTHHTGKCCIHEKEMYIIMFLKVQNSSFKQG